MQEKRMIITADDYGMSQAVNRGIDAGIRAGLITSTNVMTNMPFYAEAKRLRGEAVSLGIHWVLTCGKPVLPAAQVPTLVNADGFFYSLPEFRARFKKKLIDKADIRRELTAQAERFREFVGQPDYWNTHENVEMGFGIYQIFVDVAADMGYRRMRSQQRVYVPAKDGAVSHSIKWKIIEPFKAKLLDNWQEGAHRRGMKSPDGRICCLNGEDYHDLRYAFANIQWNGKRTTEFVIHPATHCDSEYFGGMTQNRMIEYRLFTDEHTKELLAHNGIVLCSYLDLA